MQSSGPPGRRGPKWRARATRSYDTAPTVTFVTPNYDKLAGGTSVTITGTNFRTTAAGVAPTVLFGAVAATGVVVVSPTTITATAPAATAASVVDVAVTVGTQTGTLIRAFSYYAARIVLVSPAYGPLAGGTSIVLTGDNFVTGSAITIGGVAATSVTYIDSEHYSAVTPASTTRGFKDVVIAAPTGATKTRGFQYTTKTRSNDIRMIPAVTIRDILNQSPNTAAFTIDGKSNMPVASERVEIFDGATRIFAGNAQQVEGVSEQGVDLRWDVTAIDFTWLFNARRPYGAYVNASATDVAKDLVNRFAPRFTTNFIQTGLAKITVSFDGTKDMATCLSEICAMIGGGHWYVDYEQHTHLFHTPAPDVTLPTDPEGIVATGPGTAMTVTEGTGIPSTFSFPPQWMVFFSTFVYSNGTESAPSPLANPVRMKGRKIFVFSAIPLGAAAGALTCTKRRIYARTFHSDRSNPAPLFEQFCQIDDNTTTAFTTWYRATGASVAAVTAIASSVPLPRRPYIVPPAGSPQQVSAEDGSGDLITMGEVELQFTPGSVKFRVTQLYRDGTESYGCLRSSKVNAWNGRNPIDLSNIPIGTTLNGVDVVARKVYMSYVDGPDIWAMFGFIGDNTAVEATIDTYVTSRVPMPGEQSDSVTPIWPNIDGPVLEDTDPPADITDASLDTTLMDPPLRVVTDTSQVRNRIYVRGQSSTLTVASAVGDDTLDVADISKFQLTGGTLMAGSARISYTGVSSVAVGPGTISLSTPLDVALAEGSRVQVEIMVEDVQAQITLGQVELDDQDHVTDGVHEFVVPYDEQRQTIPQLYARAYAELELFARPIVTVYYATTDAKTKSGQTVHIDLTDPPCLGDFLIQEVTIDWVYDHLTLGPRYSVRASSVKFDLSDLLLLIAAQQEENTLAGVVPAAVNQVPVPAAAAVQVATLNLTEAQLESGSTTPITIVAAQAGKIIWPVEHYVELVVTTGYGTSPTFNMIHNGKTTLLLTAINPSWGTAGTKRQKQPAVGITPAYNPANLALQVKLSANPSTPGTGVAIATIGVMYYVLSGF